MCNVGAIILPHLYDISDLTWTSSICTITFFCCLENFLGAFPGKSSIHFLIQLDRIISVWCENVEEINSQGTVNNCNKSENRYVP